MRRDEAPYLILGVVLAMAAAVAYGGFDAPAWVVYAAAMVAGIICFPGADRWMERRRQGRQEPGAGQF